MPIAPTGVIGNFPIHLHIIGEGVGFAIDCKLIGNCPGVVISGFRINEDVG